jgi:hypothetical protein
MERLTPVIANHDRCWVLVPKKRADRKSEFPFHMDRNAAYYEFGFNRPFDLKSSSRPPIT